MCVKLLTHSCRIISPAWGCANQQVHARLGKRGACEWDLLEEKSETSRLVAPFAVSSTPPSALAVGILPSSAEPGRSGGAAEQGIRAAPNTQSLAAAASQTEPPLRQQTTRSAPIILAEADPGTTIFERTHQGLAYRGRFHIHPCDASYWLPNSPRLAGNCTIHTPIPCTET